MTKEKNHDSLDQGNLTKEVAFKLNEVSAQEKAEGRTFQVVVALKGRDTAEGTDSLMYPLWNRKKASVVEQSQYKENG